MSITTMNKLERPLLININWADLNVKQMDIPVESHLGLPVSKTRRSQYWIRFYPLLGGFQKVRSWVWAARGPPHSKDIRKDFKIFQSPTIWQI